MLRIVTLAALGDNVLANPDKFDEGDPNHMLTNIVSDYWSIDRVNNILNTCGSKAISFFHCNVRSLLKKLYTTHLNELIYSIDAKPDILAVSDTKLSENNVVNVDIARYNFYHTDSKILILKTQEFIERIDELLKYLNQHKYQVVLLGEINIDFLRYMTHQKTEKYSDMLYENNFLKADTNNSPH